MNRWSSTHSERRRLVGAICGSSTPSYPVERQPLLHSQYPWTTPAHQKAAGAFLKFLLSEPIQLRALRHGFRPGNPGVSLKKPDSPFVRYANIGLNIDLPSICDLPSVEVIENLQAGLGPVRNSR